MTPLRAVLGVSVSLVVGCGSDPTPTRPSSSSSGEGAGSDVGGSGPNSSSASSNSGAGGDGASSSSSSSTNTGAGLPAGGFILAGHVVSPSQTFAGQVHVVGRKIVCAAPGTTCSDESPGIDVVETNGVIAPGLVDTHNHILFDVFDDDDWVPTIPATCTSAASCESSKYCAKGKCACVDGACKYLDHDQWPKEAEYSLMLDYKQCLEDASQGKPVWCPQALNGDTALKCEMDKWGELKGLLTGTTSIVGLPGNSSACFGSLARSIDVAQNDLDFDAIQTSALFPPSGSAADGACANIADGSTDAYLIHVGEGVNATALGEFAKLFSLTDPDGCLYAPQTTITHGTAFGPPEFSKMAAAGMKLTWSPASNVALYGVTTDIPAALSAGVLVSLAPDWSMGGSPNLLQELKFARAWADDHWPGVLSDQDLVEMVTVNATTVLGLANDLGRVEAGYLADLVVLGSGGDDPYGQIVRAGPADIKLVIVDGVPLVGAPELQELAPKSPGCETVDACGSTKFACVAEANAENKLDQTLAEIESALESGLELLDDVPTLAASACDPPCKATEACYARTVSPVASNSECGGSCPTGEKCFRVAASGDNQFECRTVNACAPIKHKPLAPVAPLFACP